jgi:hypothetical protein
MPSPKAAQTPATTNTPMTVNNIAPQSVTHTSRFARRQGVALLLFMSIIVLILTSLNYMPEQSASMEALEAPHARAYTCAGCLVTLPVHVTSVNSPPGISACAACTDSYDLYGLDVALPGSHSEFTLIPRQEVLEPSTVTVGFLKSDTLFNLRDRYNFTTSVNSLDPLAFFKDFGIASTTHVIINSKVISSFKGLDALSLPITFENASINAVLPISITAGLTFTDTNNAVTRHVPRPTAWLYEETSVQTVYEVALALGNYDASDRYRRGSVFTSPYFFTPDGSISRIRIGTSFAHRLAPDFTTETPAYKASLWMPQGFDARQPFIYSDNQAILATIYYRGFDEDFGYSRALFSAVSESMPDGYNATSLKQWRLDYILTNLHRAPRLHSPVVAQSSAIIFAWNSLPSEPLYRFDLTDQITDYQLIMPSDQSVLYTTLPSLKPPPIITPVSSHLFNVAIYTDFTQKSNNLIRPNASAGGIQKPTPWELSDLYLMPLSLDTFSPTDELDVQSLLVREGGLVPVFDYVDDTSASAVNRNGNITGILLLPSNSQYEPAFLPSQELEEASLFALISSLLPGGAISQAVTDTTPNFTEATQKVQTTSLPSAVLASHNRATSKATSREEDQPLSVYLGLVFIAIMLILGVLWRMQPLLRSTTAVWLGVVQSRMPDQDMFYPIDSPHSHHLPNSPGDTGFNSGGLAHGSGGHGGGWNPDLRVEFFEGDGMTTIDGHVVVSDNRALITLRRNLGVAERELGRQVLLKYAHEHSDLGVYLWNVSDESKSADSPNNDAPTH